MKMLVDDDLDDEYHDRESAARLAASFVENLKNGNVDAVKQREKLLYLSCRGLLSRDTLDMLDDEVPEWWDIRSRPSVNRGMSDTLRDSQEFARNLFDDFMRAVDEDDVCRVDDILQTLGDLKDEGVLPLDVDDKMHMYVSSWTKRRRRQDPRSVIDLVKRDREIVSLRQKEDKTYREIGENYGISRERVRQVLARFPEVTPYEEVVDRRRARKRDTSREALRKDLEQNPAQAVADLVIKYGLSSSDVQDVAKGLGVDGALITLRRGSPTGPRMSEDQMLGFVRTCFEEIGRPSKFGAAAYDRWRNSKKDSTIPSSQTIVIQIGWRTACERIGAIPTDPPPGRGEYSRTTEEECLSSVFEWMRTSPENVSSHWYAIWARDNQRASRSTVMRRLGGDWSSIRARAYEWGVESDDVVTSSSIDDRIEALARVMHDYSRIPLSKTEPEERKTLIGVRRLLASGDLSPDHAKTLDAALPVWRAWPLTSRISRLSERPQVEVANEVASWYEAAGRHPRPRGNGGTARSVEKEFASWLRTQRRARTEGWLPSQVGSILDARIPGWSD